jgi:hypothetical protein
MGRKKIPPPLPPKPPASSAPEHDAARAAVVENLVTEGVVAGVSFRDLSRQVLKQYGEQYGLGRPEVEDAIRRAEESLRSELASQSAHQRAVTGRQLMTLRDRLFREARMTQDSVVLARLSARHGELSEKLASLFGWNEPERLRVEVSGPSDRLRKVLEDFDDEEYTRIAAEEEEKERQLGVLRQAAGLPARTPIAVRRDHH